MCNLGKNEASNLPYLYNAWNKTSKLMEITSSTTADDQIIVTWQMKCIILQKFQDHNIERPNEENVSAVSGSGRTCY